MTNTDKKIQFLQEEITTLGDIVQTQVNTINSLIEIVTMLKTIVLPKDNKPLPDKVINLQDWKNNR